MIVKGGGDEIETSAKGKKIIKKGSVGRKKTQMQRRKKVSKNANTRHQTNPTVSKKKSSQKNHASEQQREPIKRVKTVQKPKKKSNKTRESAGASKKQKAPNPLLVLVFNLMFYLLIILIIGGSIFFVTSKDSNKSFLGYRVFGVLTDSMVPRDPETQKDGFSSGDIIVVKNVPGDRLKVGDIATFRPTIDGKSFLTHRVKQKLDGLGDQKGTYYITQGDANKAEDVPIHEKQIVGKKVFVIPKIGGILEFVRENFVVSIIFLISIVGFVTVLRYYTFT